jgi:hypothetical protein
LGELKTGMPMQGSWVDRFSVRTSVIWSDRHVAA